MLAVRLRDGPEYTTRFQRDVEMLMSLQHPNLARLYEASILPSGISETCVAYLVTDYIQGQTLAAYLRSLPRSGAHPPWTQIVQLMADISLALDYAHEHGVVHGRLKPTNILLSWDSTNSGGSLMPIITDIGLMRLLATLTSAQERQALDVLFYTSPEQARGAAATERSDLYTLGVMLYELCTGMVPFRGTAPLRS
jgi:serine/threonine protein kinase